MAVDVPSCAAAIESAAMEAAYEQTDRVGEVQPPPPLLLLLLLLLYDKICDGIFVCQGALSIPSPACAALSAKKGQPGRCCCAVCRA